VIVLIGAPLSLSLKTIVVYCRAMLKKQLRKSDSPEWLLPRSLHRFGLATRPWSPGQYRAGLASSSCFPMAPIQAVPAMWLIDIPIPGGSLARPAAAPAAAALALTTADAAAMAAPSVCWFGRLKIWSIPWGVPEEEVVHEVEIGGEWILWEWLTANRIGLACESAWNGGGW